MTRQMEQELLEQLLAGATRLSEEYREKIDNSNTGQQIAKMTGRQARYDCIRMLIGDLMMG